jgi:hypothetical protein
LPRSYDGAVSTFDSLNHILSEDALRSTLCNTAGALKAGSTFVFDMLTEEAYQTHWGEGFVIVRDDHVLTITGAAYDFRSRMAQCTITMFRLIDGSWKREDVVVRERCYTARELDSALSDAGFGSVNCYAAADLGMAGELGAGRTFYIATRC